MKIRNLILPAAWLLGSPLALAGGITEKCDGPAMRPKVTAALSDIYRMVGGTVNVATVKITPVVPKAILQPGQAAVLATAEITNPTEDGKDSDTGTFAAQFSMDYETCTPSFLGSGRLY